MLTEREADRCREASQLGVALGVSQHGRDQIGVELQEWLHGARLILELAVEQGDEVVSDLGRLDEAADLELVEPAELRDAAKCRVRRSKAGSENSRMASGGTADESSVRP